MKKALSLLILLSLTTVSHTMRARADDPLVTTQVMFYSYPGEVGPDVEAINAILIQGEEAAVMGCLRPDGGTIPSDTDGIKNYLLTKCKFPQWDLGGIAHQMIFQKASHRFILAIQPPSMIATIENETGLMSGTQTYTLDLKDTSTMLATYALILHPEGEVPNVRSNHFTLLRLAQGNLQLPPVKHETQVIGGDR